MKVTEWAIARVAENTPERGRGPGAGRRVQELVSTLSAVRSGGGQIFGMNADNLEEGGGPRLASAVIDALVAWKKVFEDEGDAYSLLQLDKVGRRLDAPALASPRGELRCGPLGSREGLSPAWLARLARVDEAVRGERALDLAAVQHLALEVADDPDAIEVELGEPDEDALHEKILQIEQQAGVAFPRELAAFYATVDGVTIDGDAFLYRLAEWETDDDGMVIGQGHYVQGRLVILEPADPSRVHTYAIVDKDDDGEECARYADFGALIDALFGM